MSKSWKFVLLFIGVLLAQLFVFDNIELWHFVVPYVYIIFILVLPINTTRPFLYLLGFFLGLSIDILSSTLCLHAAATTFMAFLRAPLISLFTTQQQLQKTTLPLLRVMGFSWTLRYTLILVLAHHSLLHTLASAPLFTAPWQIVLRILLNTLITSLVLLIIELFMYPPSERAKN